MANENQRKAVESVKSVLKLDSLKEYQNAAMSSLLGGKDCFISQPTGAGKSAVISVISFCFWLVQPTKIKRCRN